MKVNKARVAVNVSGLTGHSSNTPIHGLPQLTNHHHGVNRGYSDGIKNGFECRIREYLRRKKLVQKGGPLPNGLSIELYFFILRI
jgi:hypothetical protein